MTVNEQFSPRRAPYWLVLLLTLVSLPALGELYRYKNANGVTVLGNRVPPEFARNGYTVLSDKGRVLEVVPRQLSEEELLAYRQAQEEEAARLQAIEEQEAEDRQLLRIYSTADDVIRVRDTKLAGVHNAIVSAEEKLKRLLERQRDLEADFANIERNGGTISASRLETMSRLGKSIARTEADIVKGQEEIEALQTRFAAEHARMTELISGEAGS